MKYELLKELPGVKAGRIIVDEGLFVFEEPTTPAERMYRFKKEEIVKMTDWFKENNVVFNHKRIKDRIDDLKEIEDAFNAARQKTETVIGRGEFNDGDWCDMLEDKFKDFNDYITSKTK